MGDADLDEFDPYQKHAFIDPYSKILDSWGYQTAECSILKTYCDTPIDVAWDFNLEPGKWRYDDSVSPPVWVPYP